MECVQGSVLSLVQLTAAALAVGRAGELPGRLAEHVQRAGALGQLAGLTPAVTVQLAGCVLPPDAGCDPHLAVECVAAAVGAAGGPWAFQPAEATAVLQAVAASACDALPPAHPACQCMQDLAWHVQRQLEDAVLTAKAPDNRLWATRPAAGAGAGDGATSTQLLQHASRSLEAVAELWLPCRADLADALADTLARFDWKAATCKPKQGQGASPLAAPQQHPRPRQQADAGIPADVLAGLLRGFSICGASPRPALLVIITRELGHRLMQLSPGAIMGVAASLATLGSSPLHMLPRLMLRARRHGSVVTRMPEVLRAHAQRQLAGGRPRPVDDAVKQVGC
jgi:hypothetical protein